MNPLFLLFLVMALAALLFACLAQAMTKRPATKRLVIGNARRKFFRRHLQRIYLAPLLIERIAALLGFRSRPGYGLVGTAAFANIGDGVYKDGIRTYTCDAVSANNTASGLPSRYLMYKIGSDADHVTFTTPGDVPLGSSDDVCTDTTIPIAVKLFGATMGTTRIITDGTLLNGSKVTTGANGMGTVAVTTNLIVGVAIIPTDASANAGDAITIIPQLPLKSPF